MMFLDQNTKQTIKNSTIYRFCSSSKCEQFLLFSVLYQNKHLPPVVKTQGTYSSFKNNEKDSHDQVIFQIQLSHNGWLRILLSCKASYCKGLQRTTVHPTVSQNLVKWPNKQQFLKVMFILLMLMGFSGEPCSTVCLTCVWIHSINFQFIRQSPVFVSKQVKRKKTHFIHLWLISKVSNFN